MTTETTLRAEHKTLQVRLTDCEIAVDIAIPEGAAGLIIIAGHPGSGRGSSVNRRIADILNESGFATALADLLSAEERDLNGHTGELCHGLDLLARRVIALTDWSRMQKDLSNMPIGYFGDSMGAESVLIATTKRPEVIRAVVACGARLERVTAALGELAVPASFIAGIAGDEDVEVSGRYMSRLHQLPRKTERLWQAIGDAADPLDDPALVERVALAARDWFIRYVPVAG